MSSVAIRLEGSRFGRIVVLEEHGRDDWGQLVWLCRCDCGTTKTVVSSKLRSGNTVSCGCHRREACKEASTIHGLSNTPEYRSYRAMLRRCYDETHRAYPYYGGRGIKVCERWRKDFSKFYSDLGRRPEGLTLDRIENDGDYEPNNCCWATWEEQHSNKRTYRSC